MSMIKIFAAVGLAVAAVGATAPAQADRYDHGNRWDNDRRWDHGRRDHRWERDHHNRLRCWNEWHHHHRVRVCR